MKSAIIGLKELREHTEDYITRVKKGRSFVVVRKSKPIFKITPVDEWGDEGAWETVVDFTDISPEGIPATEVRRVLRGLRKERRKK